MAQPQAYAQPYPQQNKGTLVPGQTISVNKYTVQVERYLSQGGFAHVYLVRTAQPVYGTTHHVLKRIAVPNEAMLTEVKKEVDIMRILKGHPNIVYLIDAAWHRSSDGVYEVFILMEYCPGGGIIDMMNRRLRERLTEPEILTIFVDVCEGLAAMHALKPPLLHRDLKVENILQSSPTSYKLCDFGSATPVQKVPANIQELRALENDLNRHTTLQYRAPEMVDVYQRRPIDEKSDVWALGVLLYKLCYYTTPFEEHGPLAILNVQYKIPPYPVYSHQMNALIASMLREHGAQRPTVFEILNHVHALRGSKPRFQYTMPQKQPSVPRPLQPLSSNIGAPASTSNALDDLVTFKSRATQPSPQRNAGTESRDKVLEAIAPMRRGRPGQSSVPEQPQSYQPPPSPRKDRERAAGGAGFNLDMKFGAEEDKAWKGVRGHKSGMASFGSSSANPSAAGDAWGLGGKDAAKEKVQVDKLQLPNGFDSDFSSSFGKGFGDAFEPSKPLVPTPSPSKPQPIPGSRPTPSPGLSGSPSKSRTSKDAFDGLGLSSQQAPPQTLGEARRARTGLATAGVGATPSASSGQYLSPPGQASSQASSAGIGSSYTTYRPPSTQGPFPSPRVQPASRPHSPVAPSSRAPSKRPGELSAEERFPSLEDLDRTFTSPNPSSSVPNTLHAQSQPASTERLPERPAGARPPSRGGVRTGNLLGLPVGAGPAPAQDRGTGRYDGVRSQHVTGTAMRDARLGHNRSPTAADATPEPAKSSLPRRSGTVSGHTRPRLERRHRSSISIKHTASESGPSLVDVPSSSNADSRSSPASAPALPPRPSPKPPAQQPPQRDWLTGASDDEAAPPPRAQPVLRESPSKRASYIERSPVQLERPLEAESVVPAFAPDDRIERERAQNREWERELERERERQKEAVRAHQREKDAARTEERARLAAAQRLPTGDKARRPDAGRVSPTKPHKAFVTRTGTTTGPAGGTQLPGMSSGRRTAPPPLASADSGLTENWSPVASPTRPLRRDSTSSSDEGPEDLNGYVPRGGGAGARGGAQPSAEPEPERRRHGAKGRQNSVHDLVDLWGGPGPASPTKLADKRRSAIVTSSSMMKQAYTLGEAFSKGATPVTSPTLVSPTPEEPAPAPQATGGRALPRPPSSQQVRKQTTLTTGTSPRTSSSASPVPPAVTPSASVSAASTGRARPQSMFINPVLKTAPLEPPAPSSTSAPKPQDQAEPQKRTARRTSISDMVQRYEAINGSSKPPVAAKPAPLSLKATAAEPSGGGLPSPSAAATRFPQLSPPSSPQLGKASLAVPDDEPSKKAFQGRRSPSPARVASPRPGPARPAEQPNGARASAPGARPAFERRATLPPPEDAAPPRRSSDEGSPERPYQGVSSLINRWQHIVEEQGGAQRKPSGSLRGR